MKKKGLGVFNVTFLSTLVGGGHSFFNFFTETKDPFEKKVWETLN